MDEFEKVPLSFDFSQKELSSSPEQKLDSSTLLKYASNEYEFIAKQASERKELDTPGEIFDEGEVYGAIENDDITNEMFSGSVATKLGTIGLALLPNQRKQLVHKNGSKFTLMVTGASGTGKSTFINTLFGENIFSNQYSKLDLKGNPVVDDISVYRTELIENEFKLNLTVITTPTFGSKINNQHSWSPAEKYIDEQFRLYLYQEEQPNRERLFDSRVHCCLYFIQPTGTHLSTLDIETMKLISERTNLIPIISKSDTFTRLDLTRFKEMVRNTLRLEHINVCDFILDQSVSDNINRTMPFAIISSNNDILETPNGVRVRGRQYEWGIAETDNPDHCDFIALREILMGKNMLDLILSTETHYENYRKTCLLDRFREVQGSEYDFDSIKLDGLQELEIFHKFKLQNLEMKIHECDITYITKEKEAKIRFSKVVAVQEKRFKEWKRALIERQDQYNKEIEQLHIRIIRFQEEIEFLECGNKSIENSLNSLSLS